MNGCMKRQRLALHDQGDFTALKSIRSQKTIWTSAGQRLQPPTGEILVFSLQSRLPRTGVMSCEWRGGGDWGGGGGGAELSRAAGVSLVTADKV